MTALPELLAKLPGSFDLTARPDGSVQINTYPYTERSITVAAEDDGWLVVTRWTDGDDREGEDFDDVDAAAGYVTGHLGES